MTEAEWLASTDPAAMLGFVAASSRDARGCRIVDLILGKE